MQCSRCGGFRSIQVPKAWWQLPVPCTARVHCTICGRSTLILVPPATLRPLLRRMSELLQLDPSR
jgi:hypothetical protein